MNKKPFMPGLMTVKDLKEDLDRMPEDSYVYVVAHDQDMHMADPVKNLSPYDDKDDETHVMLTV